MSERRATLHMLCGKIAAGKSTLAARLSAEPNTVLISEDYWLSRLYPSEITTLQDYVRCSTRLCAAIAPHIETFLRFGVSVVLDFPANTTANRKWMRSLFENSNAEHQLHFLDAPDDVCKARLHTRNDSGTHEYKTNDEEFDLFTSHFVPPQDDESFNVVRYSFDQGAPHERPKPCAQNPEKAEPA